MTFLKTAAIALLPAVIILSGCKDKAPSLHLETEIPHAQLGDNVSPLKYDLDMRIDPKADTMSGVVSITVDIEKPTEQIWLHGKHMTVTEAFALQGDDVIKAEFTEIDAATAPSGVARLNFEAPVSAGEAVLTLSYETPYNLNLNSAYKVTRADENYIVTQFEPLGAREAFPSFDEPRFKVPFNMSISSPTENVVFANTPTISTVADGATDGVEWTKHVFVTTRPLPTYLIAFGAGPYEINDFGQIPPNDIRRRPIDLRGFTAQGSKAQIQYGLENTAGILTALEGYFGTEYPYEKLDLIAAPDYAFGAMENPGAIVYREYLMLLDDDAPLSQKRAYARVHSHELAHQWFGNLVTPVWWEDIWLNEAFATWAGNKGTALWSPEGNYDRLTLNAALGAMNIDSLSTTRRVREPLERSENVMDQFDGITYRKGGGVLSMFESYVGENAFRDGVRLHMERYADDVATADDFFQSIADGSGNPDVVDAMKSFVDQKGVPLVYGSMKCETDGVEIEGLTELDLTQSRYAPLGSAIAQGAQWQIPVCASFGFGGDTVKQCTLMKEKTATLIPNHESGKCADWVMLNQDGAGYYRFSLDSESWAALLDNLGALNAREVLAAQDSLIASFEAGVVDAGVFIKGMELFAQSNEYDVASQAGSYLGWMDSHLPVGSYDDLTRLTQDMYAERYKAIAGTDTIEGDLLAPTLAGRLIAYGNDTKLRAEFAKNGALYLGLDGPADKGAVASNMLSRALREAMRSRASDAYPKLMDIVKSGSAFEKGAALGALASTNDLEIAAKLRETALNDTDAMTGRQATSLLSMLMGSSVHGEESWAWLQSNFDDFVTTRVADVRKPGMPRLAGGYCSEAQAVKAEKFFESKAALIPGYERNLAQTLESIRLCAALKDHASEDLAKALAER